MARKGKRTCTSSMGRGFINENKWSDYRVRKEDNDGQLIPHLILHHMMESCDDFDNEISQLEHIGPCRVVRVVITTQYHAEYDGEGIEYSWGLSTLFTGNILLMPRKVKKTLMIW
jgi:hypothetical protein